MLFSHVYLTIAFVFVCATTATLYEVFVPCCHEGVLWSSLSYRCDNYPAPVANISSNDQAACLAIIEVCCIKQTQVTTCEEGKQTALDGDVCAIRDADPGAEQFRECCHCCRLGLESRQSQPTCQTPGLGEPCDSKYRECCLGEETNNFNFTDLQGKSKRGSNTVVDNNEGQATNETDEPPTTTVVVSTEASPTSIYENTTEEEKIENTGTCRDGHDCHHRCVDDLQGFKKCLCYDGFRLQADEKTCKDINECSEGIARCAPSQKCFNTEGRYTCRNTRCLPGQNINRRTGRCEQIHQQCQPGFAHNSVTRKCEDLNECGLGTDACKVGERCENNIGSYSCRRIHHCGTGYTLDDFSQRCVDNDECRLGTHNCRSGYKCQNLQGSFRCVPKPCNSTARFDHIKGQCVLVKCPKGFKSNSARNCEDVNECTELGRSPCRQFQRCINTRGSFYCRNIVNCPPGYEATDKERCQDIDECVKGTHKCGPEQQCINRQGTYFCQCPRGLRHDNLGRCIDVDECSYGASICPSNSKCVNTVGSYKCECVDGLQVGDGDSCTDIDECAQQGICQQSCVNVLGTFFCTCDRGYQLRDDKRSCEDIDECTQFGGRGGRSGVCAGRCINIPGSYKCECSEGWRLKDDGRSCEDINECQERSAFCPQLDSLCINTRGGYKCPVVRCPDGFLKTNSSGQQNREFVTEEDGVVCRREECDVEDTVCLLNKTKTISWQFLPLPSVDFIRAPLTILNIRTIGYSSYPNLRLKIAKGNEEGIFDAMVRGDRAALRLVKSLTGPVEKHLTMVLENRDFTGENVMTRHITNVHVMVGSEPYNNDI